MSFRSIQDLFSPPDPIQVEALQVGFDLVGVCSPAPPEHLNFYREWLAAGYAADMHYLERHVPLKAHLPALLPSVRSVIVVACNYYLEAPEPRDYQIARYARGDDYHDLLRGMLERFARGLTRSFPELEYRAFVDSGPLLERDLAVRAGLGWIGKNTCLIAPGKGSWFLLGALLTNLELPFSPPFENLHCGSCTRCLEACPTEAFVAPYTLDARRCIAYLTIENRGEIPTDLRTGTGSHLFGCDRCQDVCPWNQRFAHPTTQSAFWPREWLEQKTIPELLALSAHDFELLIAPRSPIKRPKYRGFMRNLAVVVGNSGRLDYLPALQYALKQHAADPLLQEHLQWAIQRLHSVAVAPQVHPDEKADSQRD